MEREFGRVPLDVNLVKERNLTNNDICKIFGKTNSQSSSLTGALRRKGLIKEIGKKEYLKNKRIYHIKIWGLVT